MKQENEEIINIKLYFDLLTQWDYEAIWEHLTEDKHKTFFIMLKMMKMIVDREKKIKELEEKINEERGNL